MKGETMHPPKSIRHALRGLGLALVGAGVLAGQPPARRSLVVTARNVTRDAPADSVTARPGDVIRYSLVFTNVTAAAVTNVRFTDPLPAGLVYVPGSATVDRRGLVEYSIDGGKTYAARPMMVVIENGKRVEKGAPPEAYTHIRWTVVGSLAPAAQVTAEFEARVKR